MATITISIDGCELKEIDQVSVTFKDGRPTTSFTRTRTDEDGNYITTTTVAPYNGEDPQRSERRGKRFEKKQSD